MVVEKIFLKDEFVAFEKEGNDAYITCYIQDNLSEMRRDNNKRPCVVVCPGGGYAFCSQREAEPIALALLPMGFNVVILNYSVEPNRFPTALLQVAATYELINKYSDEWHIDTEKTAVMGFSAGGHLAAHYSTCFDCDEVRSVFPVSRRPFASILCYPVISAYTPHEGSFINLLGHFPQNEEMDKFSLEKQVKENTPQAFIWHTAEDGAVPVENSLDYAKALSKYNIPFELHIYPFGDHGLSTADKQTCDVINENIAGIKWLEALKKWAKITFNI